MSWPRGLGQWASAAPVLPRCRRPGHRHSRSCRCSRWHHRRLAWPQGHGGASVSVAPPERLAWRKGHWRSCRCSGQHRSRPADPTGPLSRAHPRWWCRSGQTSGHCRGAEGIGGVVGVGGAARADLLGQKGTGGVVGLAGGSRADLLGRKGTGGVVGILAVTTGVLFSRKGLRRVVSLGTVNIGILTRQGHLGIRHVHVGGASLGIVLGAVGRGAQSIGARRGVVVGGAISGVLLAKLDVGVGHDNLIASDVPIGVGISVT